MLGNIVQVEVPNEPKDKTTFLSTNDILVGGSILIPIIIYFWRPVWIKDWRSFCKYVLIFTIIACIGLVISLVTFDVKNGALLETKFPPPKETKKTILMIK